MPSEMEATHTRIMRWHWWPEVVLAVLASAVFLGYFGAIDLWGKREQRAAVEAIDTVDHQHILVAELQGRPRLEKPPLPRWSIAAIVWLTGRRDEWIVRLPSALCGLATVALVLALGRRMAGEPVGRAAAFVLCSTGFFVGEMRQASNDAPLTLFTTVALYAAWRRLHPLALELPPLPSLKLPPIDKGGSGGVAGLDRSQDLHDERARSPSPQSVGATPPGPPLSRGEKRDKTEGSREEISWSSIPRSGSGS